MTTRLSFALTALISLFFLEGLSGLFGVLFAIVYDGIFPEVHFPALLLAVVPLAALLAPALPFSRWLGRSTLVMASASIAAAARVPMTLPAFPVRYGASALVVASGAIFLGKAVGFLDRRVTAAAVASAFVLDGLLRFAGTSWDVSLRSGWLAVQLLLSGFAVLLALAWRRSSASDGSQPHAEGDPLERRAGGVRLRGAVTLACLFFLQMNVLARPEVAHRWLDVSYPIAAVALTAVATAAALLIYTVRGPIGRSRAGALVLTGLCGAGILAPRLAEFPLLALAMFCAGHAAALLLLDRALVPATGRRRGWRLASGMAVLLVLTTAWALTFYYAFTIPALEGRAPAVAAFAVVLMGATLLLSPRPLPTPPGPLLPQTAVLALIAPVGTALWLALRDMREQPPIEQGPVTIATYNVHYGFAESWSYDPEKIARTIEESGAHIAALQEVPAGLITAYSTDLPLWLGRRLGLEVVFAPSINGLLGDALLTRLPVLRFETRPLPPPGSDRKLLASAHLSHGPDTLVVHAVHLGVTAEEQSVQLAASLPTLQAGARSIFAGDLNAEPGSEVWLRLRHAGFHDAFELASKPAEPTWPASHPEVRIDWIWVRGYDAVDALVSSGAGSDHRLVAARLLPR